MPFTMSTLPEGFIPPDVACFGKRYVKKYTQSVKNLRTYSYWRQLFWTACISRFKWEGLPDEIDTRFMEVLLAGWGCIGVTKRADSPISPYWVARINQQNVRDVYDNPNSIRLIAPNGYQQTRHANYWVKRWKNQYGSGNKLCPPDAVICWDNLTRLPILPLLDLQAQRLATIDQIIDQHINAQRSPWILTVDEAGKKNADALFNQILSGQPAVYAYNGVTERIGAEVIQTNANYFASDMLNDRLKIVADVYTMLGIDNNASAEKRERVQTAETLANNEQFMIQRNAFLRCRREFADKCNKLFGWDVSVKWAVSHPYEGDSTRIAEWGSQSAAPNSFFTNGEATGGMSIE